MERKSYSEPMPHIMAPETPSEDWFDIFDSITKSPEFTKDRDGKNLNLAALETNEEKYYLRTMLKAFNAKAIFGTTRYIIDYKPDKDGNIKEQRIPLYVAVRNMLVKKSDLLTKISRSRGGVIRNAAIEYPKSKDRFDTDALIAREQEKGPLRKLFEGKKGEKDVKR